MAARLLAMLRPLAVLACFARGAAAGRADGESAAPTNGSCLIQMANRVRALHVSSVSLWSDVEGSKASCTGGACVVPAGQTWILDKSMDVATLTIKGTLEWDTSRDGLEVRAGYVVVEDGGYLKVGTKDAPMDKRATIYIKRGQSHHRLGTRVLGGLGSAKIDVHGRLLRRTWTLLRKTAFAGSTQLFVKDDPERMGWRAGDRIGLATTSRGRSSVYTIDSIAPALPEPPSCMNMPDVKKTCSTNRCKVLATNMQDKTCRQYCARSGLTCAAAYEEVSNDCAVKATLTCDQTWPGTSDLLCECNPNPDAVQARGDTSGMKVLHLKEPLSDEHWGGFRTVAGRRLEMAAEVVNLERSVLITGDHDDFYASNTGLHTLVSGSGYMDVRYARVEYCGQRDVMGRYCLHFHRMGRCPLCRFEGNAVVDSAQVGITVHGTHNSLVSNNVVWDARAVGIYTEDGNEMNNLIKQNVIICSWWQTCSVNWQNNVGLHAGIFLIGMTNDLVENRVAGHENCIWTPGGARGDGHGAALTKVCPMYTPFGEIRGNVNHDCQRFGLYLDNQFPRNVKRDENGFVTDMASCQKFTPEGADNGLQPANVVRDEFDWHNMFVGQYNMGDVQFVNYTGVNNAHSMYWKSSKNFADGRLWHVEDSAILNDPSDPIGELQFLGPGGPHVFGIRNTVFAGGPTGCAALCAGQHCGLGGSGGPCNSQYLLEGVDFSGVQAGEQLLEFGVHSTDPAKVLPVFLAKDNSLGGFRSVVSGYLDGFGRVPGCSRAGAEWSHGFGCAAHVRRVNVWGPNVGDLHLSGPGYEVAANGAPPVLGMNAGRMIYEPMNGKAYGTPVLAGMRYTLHGAWGSPMVLDFSDAPLARYFGSSSEGVGLEVNGASCQLRASDDRRFLSPKGPVPRVLGSHARIEGGRLLCGAAAVEPPRPPSRCGLLGDVVDTCSADGCRVLARGMRGRPCASYCRTAGLYCTGAWESAGDGCAAVLDTTVGCDEGRPSDRLLCECGPEPAPPTTTAGRTTTTVLPPDTSVSAPPSGTKSPQAPECASLPDVKATCSADGCKVLAGSMTGLTCAEYCARSSLACVGAWEEVSNDCRVKATMACDEVWPGTSDLLCQCASVAATTTTSGGSPTQLPPVTPPPVAPPQCNLPGVKEFCSSSGCKVLAGGMLGRNCETYCAESQLVCVGAWEEVDDTCTEESSLPCNENLPRGTSDLICECTTPGAGSPGEGSNSVTAAAPAVLAWRRRQGHNCYEGNGAVGVPTKSPLPGKFLLEGCQQACEAEAACQGVVMVRQYQHDRVPYMCWLRTGLNPAACNTNTEYDLWERLPASSPGEGVGGVPPPLPGAAHVYERSGGVGGWGGWCTCPDGQRYNVGDLNDGCARGPASLACFGGAPGQCEKREDPVRKGMEVTCAAAAPLPVAAPLVVPAAAPASAPVAAPVPVAAPAARPNMYERVAGVGSWGGWCMCPDGKRYNVGDRNDGCAQGPASLACMGGTPGQCERKQDPARRGMRVTCAPPAAAPAPQPNVYERSGGVGGWGGWCTCPDGQRYNVGDLNDGCAKGPASLACVGGAPGRCERRADPAREGMKVTCAIVK